MPVGEPVPALYREAHPERPAFDMAISYTLLRETARSRGGALRLYRPGATVAFGRLDRLRPGFPDAVSAARRHGFEPVLRSSGGHAVAYDARSLIVEEISAERDIVSRLQDRFRDGTAAIAAALAATGLRPGVGELPGEYCAGTYSVNLEGRVKVAGTAQRVIGGAALFTAFIVVGGGDDIRTVLSDVYAALQIEWEPSTAGAIHDVAPHARIEEIEDALIAPYRTAGGLEERRLSAATLERAHALEPNHRL